MSQLVGKVSHSPAGSVRAGSKAPPEPYSLPAQFDSPLPFSYKQKHRRLAVFLFVVEVGRVELPSENMMTQLSTSVAVVQVFPLRRSQRRDHRSGSFIKSGPGQSLPGFVPYPD